MKLASIDLPEVKEMVDLVIWHGRGKIERVRGRVIHASIDRQGSRQWFYLEVRGVGALARLTSVSSRGWDFWTGEQAYLYRDPASIRRWKKLFRQAISAYRWVRHIFCADPLFLRRLLQFC